MELPLSHDYVVELLSKIRAMHRSGHVCTAGTWPCTICEVIRAVLGSGLKSTVVADSQRCSCGPNECCRRCQHVGGNGADRLTRGGQEDPKPPSQDAGYWRRKFLEAKGTRTKPYSGNFS
jgi:hypothetical protein